MKKLRVAGYLPSLVLLLSLLLAACGDSTSVPVNPVTSAPLPTTAANATTAALTTVAALTTAASLPTVTAAPVPTTAPVVTTVAITSSAPTTAVAATTDPTTATVSTTAAPSTTTQGTTTEAAPTTQAATTEVATAAPVATVVGPISTSAFNAAPVFYFKESGLWLTRTDGTGQQLLAPNVFSYAGAGINRLVYFQQVTAGSETVLQLKMLLIGGLTPQETILDNRAFLALSQAEQGQNGGLYGSNRVVGDLVISPDGTQVVYLKANLSGPTFSTIGGAKERPTELWLANLDPQNPAPRRLVANDKDFIFNPLWSSDGNRIAFLRTDNFGTGAGYSTPLWSVFKDGTRLAFLTGPEIGKVAGRSYRAGPANNLRWVGPLALAFQAFDGVTGNTLWLHDLSIASDFPRPLTLEAITSAAFCPGPRRYVYLKQNVQSGAGAGVFSVEVDRPGASGAPPPAAPVDPAATQLFGCEDNAVLYADAQGQSYLQRLNTDGSANGPKVKIGDPVGATSTRNQVSASLSPGASYVAIEQAGSTAETRRLALFRADGIALGLNDASLRPGSFNIRWLNEQLVAIVNIGLSQSQAAQLSVADVSQPRPILKLLDSSARNQLTLVTNGRNVRQ